MSDFYKMNDDGSTEPCDAEQWGLMFESIESRHVADSYVSGCRVSTIFLGLDHNHGGGVPILFETMIFVRGRRSLFKLHERQWRYESKAQAVAGHAAVSDAIRRKRLNRLI